MIQNMRGRYSQEKDDARVGHGKSQPQDSAAHDGVAEVEDGHAKGSLPFKLKSEEVAPVRSELTGLNEPSRVSATSTHVGEAGILPGAAFMGEKLLLLAQTYDPVEARGENRWTVERETSRGSSLLRYRCVTLTCHPRSVRSSSEAPFWCLMYPAERFCTPGNPLQFKPCGYRHNVFVHIVGGGNLNFLPF